MLGSAQSTVEALEELHRLSRRQRLTIAGVWTAAGVVSVYLLLPYLAALIPATLAKIESTGVPLWVVFTVQPLQLALLLFFGSWAGLAMGEELGLGSPIVERWITKRDPIDVRRSLPRAAVIGLAVGLVAVVLDHFVFRPQLPAPLDPSSLEIARWKGFLASFYGAIVEELQVRLFLLTLLAWAVKKAFFGGRRLPRSVYGLAIVVAAVAFAAAHLPAAGMIWPPSLMVDVRVLVLNTLVGVATGWLFCEHGLEHAVVGHFGADMALHVIVV